MARSGKGRTGQPKDGRVTPPASRRYTPPVPKSQKMSPMWVPILMFAFFGVGMLVILLNYLAILPTPGFLPHSPNNIYLVVGLAGLVGGFVTATQYH